MSLIHDCESRSITDFPGADLLRDKVHLTSPPGAILSKNVEYIHGSVSTRRGFAEFTDPNLSVERIFNWNPGERNSLLLFSRNGGTPKVAEYSQVTALTNDVATSLNASTANCVFAEIGSRVFMAFLSSAGVGISNGKVWNGSYTGSTADTDNLFQAPLAEGSPNYSVSYTDPSAGVVTAGAHKIGVVFETRNGYLTKAIEFANAYTAPGSENLVVTLDPTTTWPDWVRYAHLIMTTVQNQERFFFVPGQRVPVNQGTSLNVDFTVDIDDTILAGLPDGALATEYFNILAAGELGVPSMPKFLLEYGERMVYVADLADAGALSKVSFIYISDPGDPQHITADQHLIYLPGRRSVVSAFIQHNTLYLLGPAWTYAFVDNNDKPVTWDKAQLIDSRRGTKSPHGCSISSSGGIVWVASGDGLYPFQGGFYPDLPTSYLQTPDWERINWSAPAGAVQVVDDADSDSIYVLAPLDASNVPTHILAWDYKNGTEWSRAKYSIWDINSVNPGAITLFQNRSNKIFELLVSNSTAGKLYRRKSSQAGDANLYNDDSNPIDSQYIPPPVENFPVPVQHVAGQLALKGSGTASITAYNKNQDRSTDLGDETLSASLEADVLVLIGEQSEAVHIGVTNKNTADSWFSLSRIIEYFTPWIERR